MFLGVDRRWGLLMRVSSKEKLDKVFSKADRRHISRTSEGALRSLTMVDNFRDRGLNRATIFWALAGKVRAMLRVMPSTETRDAAKALVADHGLDFALIRTYSALQPAAYHYYIGDRLDEICAEVTGC